MRLIEIEQVLVNPEQVTAVEPLDGVGSKIYFNGLALTSSLSPLQVATLLEERDLVVHGG
ncbi:hypothetical protein [Arthrobacter sp. 31Y]|uniref:hypothetical protein n=1 Tax=Arthrobacter sp. 31Y TaxID=1115632 RepID=UPI0004661344|nr:hypothetical protein [Arthrobacter sp. 31Y]